MCTQNFEYAIFSKFICYNEQVAVPLDLLPVISILYHAYIHANI